MWQTLEKSIFQDILYLIRIQAFYEITLTLEGIFRKQPVAII